MTRRTSVLSAAAGMLLASTAIVAAQDQNSAGQSDSTPDKITCAQISTMDTATVPGVLYFISGYSQGHRAGLAGEVMNGETTELNAGGNDVSSESSSSTSDSASTSDSSSTNSDSATTDGQASGSDSATTGSDSASSSSTDHAAGDSSAQVGKITGYFEIPVEQLILACGQSPDRSVSDLLDEESRKQGGASSDGSASDSSSTNANDTSASSSSGGSDTSSDTTSSGSKSK
ncbi:hypothetical protein IC608_09060 [Devosia sp. PTR5]|uniref:Secreted protein n=1 Tax=Devosia oryzisoli TaxID=2774138 RepID=A0A927FUY4_9HYPH|nr:HdeA/HdeB family chaperone [Devosia oryzisoli]MBD8065624.1 hypothetical protein [Devosia oryzisoli]